MRLRCPKCNEAFSAKSNARTVKCPGCGFRQQAPEDGFPTTAKKGDSFVRLEDPRARPAPAPRRNVAIAVGIVAVLAVAAVAWMVLGGGGGGGGAVTGACPQLENATLQLSNPSNPVAFLDLGADGCIAVELFEDLAPRTAGNFRSLVERGYYDGTTFHRAVRDFMMQGGEGATVVPNIQDEFGPGLVHDRPGRLSMANAGPNTGNSQFFIIFAPTPHLDGKHAIFGQVVHGLEAVETINREAGRPPSDGQDGRPPLRPINLVAARMRGSSGPALDGGTSTSPTSSTTTAAPTSDAPLVPCASQPNAPLAPGGPVEVDLMTPGVWNVCADKDYAYVWVHNNGTGSLTYQLSVTGPGGAPLPAGWSVSFLAPQGTIAQAGAKDAAWAATLATLTIPADQPAGNVSAELHAGGAVRPFTFVVQSPRGTVAQPGQHAQTQYTLRHPDGRIVSPGGQGPFCVDLASPTGSGNAVPGYGWGVIGVARGETITLVVPPPFGYSYGGQFGSDTMYWTTTVTAMVPSCR